MCLAADAKLYDFIKVLYLMIRVLSLDQPEFAKLPPKKDPRPYSKLCKLAGRKTHAHSNATFTATASLQTTSGRFANSRRKRAAARSMPSYFQIFKNRMPGFANWNGFPRPRSPAERPAPACQVDRPCAYLAATGSVARARSWPTSRHALRSAAPSDTRVTSCFSK